MNNTMNVPTSRNGAPVTSCRTATGSAVAAEPVTTRAGASRSSQAWIGRQTRKCRLARPHKAPRQPQAAISQAVKGMNTVLARPPRKVIVMMARRKSLGKRRVTTANTGVYKIADMATPSAVQTR